MIYDNNIINDAISESYNDGYSVDEIASLYKVSIAYVTKVLSTTGVTKMVEDMSRSYAEKVFYADNYNANVEV
jgi:AraC-like DNA-binding protein